MQTEPVERPFLVTILCLGVLISAGILLIRLERVISLWGFLSELPLSIPPWYIALTSSFVGLGGLAVVWALWSGHPLAPWAGMGYGIVYALMHWVERLFFFVQPGGENGWAALAAALFWLAILLSFLRTPESKRFFRQRHGI